MSEAKLELMKWVKSFARKRVGKQHFVLDGFNGDFCLVFDFDDDPETPAAEHTCDILIEPLAIRSDDPIRDHFLIVANANKHGVMRLLAAIGINEFPEKVKKAYYELANPLRCTTEAISVPTVYRPATGRSIPDLRKREHVCEFQREIKPV